MQQRTVDIFDVSVRQVVKEIMQVAQFAPQERASERASQLVNEPVPQNLEEIAELGRLERGCAYSRDYGGNVEFFDKLFQEKVTASAPSAMKN